ncbi:MAG: hypothetical protein R6U29_01820, partial [Desulfosudaceae bacterium]
REVTMKNFQPLNLLERIMMAVTFAETNVHDTSRRIMDETRRPRKRVRQEKEKRAEHRPQMRL